MKDWKIWQEMYNRLVQDHTDARHLHRREEQPFHIEDALNYVRQQSPIGIYPAKSFMVAIIYAKMINEVYGDDFYETLNDPDLLYNQDDYFVPYFQAKDTYDQILLRLDGMGIWWKYGWAPKTVEYFYAECTQEGYEKLAAEMAA